MCLQVDSRQAASCATAFSNEGGGVLRPVCGEGDAFVHTAGVMTLVVFRCLALPPTPDPTCAYSIQIDLQTQVDILFAITFTTIFLF